MKLLTQEIKKLLPEIGETDGKPRDQTKVPLKLFDPCGRGTWFITEFDGEDQMFGFVVSPLGDDCDEFGYMSLSEMESVRNRLGLTLERDTGWNPDTTLDKVLAKLKSAA